MAAGADPAASGAGPAFRLVGGKGGVGKTTCAAAIAVHAARSGRRTLVISTDPAPSLGDALGARLGPAPRRVPLPSGAPLHAVEIEAGRVIGRWLAERRASLARIATRGTWLDDEDIDRLLRLTLPGIDEIAGLLEIARYGRTRRYDAIVVDTAPTGHTLRMLAGPELLQRVARLFDTMQGRHRAVVAALRGYWQPDAEDELIASLDADSRELAALMRDPARTRITWVTLPERMAVAETVDAMAELGSAGIDVHEILVNRLTPEPGSRCGHCSARRAFEGRALAALRRSAPRLPLIGVGARDREPRGAVTLGRIGDEIWSAKPPQPAPVRRSARWWFRTRPGAGAADGLADDTTRLLMFGGKGGVGKTTCAAAAALVLSARRPGSRTLLLSTDPAHSLQDALGIRIGDEPVRLPRSRLVVRELDARARFETLRERYARAVEEVFDRIVRGSAVDATLDRRVMANLIDLAPPGVDELVGIAEIADLLDDGHGGRLYDLVVVDMAPSGHALRLLTSPALVQEWARTIMAILLKYQAVVSVGELGSMLLELSRSLGRFNVLLHDATRTRVVAVTRAAALPLAETRRFVAHLKSLNVPVSHVLVNAVGRGTCPRCRRVAAAERRELAATRSALRGQELILTPAELPPPCAAAGLRRWANAWRG